MREAFHRELEQLGDQLTAMCTAVRSSMQRATRALLDVDLTLAEQVIAEENHTGQLAARCEEHACRLLALQAPKATDLRIVVAGIKAAERIERMGELARHVALIVRLRYPQPAVPAELLDQVARMSQLVLAASQDLERVVAGPREACSRGLDQADEEINRLHRDLLAAVRDANPPYRVQTGIDVALLARFLERFADQAVAVAHRLDHVVSGEIPHTAPGR